MIFEKWEDNAKNTVALHSLNVIQENYKNNYRFCKYNRRYSITLTEAIFFGENNVHCLLLVLHKQHIMLPFVAIQCHSVQKGIGLQSVYNQSAAMIKWRLKQSIPCCAFTLHWHKKICKENQNTEDCMWQMCARSECMQKGKKIEARQNNRTTKRLTDD